MHRLGAVTPPSPAAPSSAGQRVSASAKRILFFPLSNVLGHLTRTLALAEELDAQGHEVHVALDHRYPDVIRALPPRIRVLATPEMDAGATRSFGPIVRYDDCVEGNRANLESANRMDRAELRRRAARLGEMVRRDVAILEEVRPDAVITDYRFTTELVPRSRPENVFHISHLLGYPSLYRRLTSAHFFPLDSGRLLVPGVRAIECWRREASDRGSAARESLCGPFRWRGWQRMSRETPLPPPADVFLCFGSTGRAEQIVPWLLENIPEHYRISGIAAGQAHAAARRGAYLEQRGDLERFLPHTEVVFCHGGHGTVMECIFHRAPMAIFPQNIEQLEIGRCIEALGLGVLVKQPYEQLRGQQLAALIEKLRTDACIKLELEKYSALLRADDGPRRAASIVLDSLGTVGAAPAAPAEVTLAAGRRAVD